MAIIDIPTGGKGDDNDRNRIDNFTRIIYSILFDTDLIGQI